jgi:hypothetical protein
MARWFPSKARLRQLKAVGIFSWSSLATRSAVLAVVAGFVCARPELINTLLVYDPSSEWLSPTHIQTLRIYTRSVCSFVVATAVASLVVGIGVSLIQTRGALGWSALRAVRTQGRRRSPLTSVAGLGVAFAVAYCLSYFLGPKFLVAHNSPGAQPTGTYLGELLQYTAKLVVVASVVLAVVLLFVNRIAFLIGLKKRTRRMGADES